VRRYGKTALTFSSEAAPQIVEACLVEWDAIQIRNAWAKARLAH